MQEILETVSVRLDQLAKNLEAKVGHFKIRVVKWLKGGCLRGH